MENHKVGDYVWCVCTARNKGYIAEYLKNVLVLEVTGECYRVKVSCEASVVVGPEQLYARKNDAVGVSIRRLQEELINE